MKRSFEEIVAQRQLLTQAHRVAIGKADTALQSALKDLRASCAHYIPSQADPQCVACGLKLTHVETAKQSVTFYS